jgi:hypothetical protein
MARPSAHHAALSSRAGSVVLVAALLSACVHPGSGASSLPCAGHTCDLIVQNDGSADIGLQYFDSTGQHENLGLLQIGAVKRYHLRWIRSSAIDVYAIVGGKQSLVSTVRLDRNQAIYLHFPGDFDVGNDLLSASRPKP